MKLCAFAHTENIQGLLDPLCMCIVHWKCLASDIDEYCTIVYSVNTYTTYMCLLCVTMDIIIMAYRIFPYTFCFSLSHILVRVFSQAFPEAVHIRCERESPV